ncbi:plastid transcriptionally active 2 isoform X1 [Carex rostrata]
MALLSSSSSVCCSLPSTSFHTTNLLFLFTSEPSRTIRVRHRGPRPLATLTTNSKPQTQQDRLPPLRVQPESLEKGKYSYQVKSLIDRISQLPPRGSIAKCLETCKNKLSISDFALVYREFARRGDWQRSLRLFKYMQRHTWCRPDEHIYAILIGVLGRHGLLAKAQDVFLDMPTYSIPRTALSYTSLINSYARNGDHDTARSLLNQMKSERIPPTVLTYNTIINSFARADIPWDVLLGLFAEMRHDGIHPDIVTYNTLLAAAGARGLAEEAEIVLKTMLESGVLPDLTTHKYLVDMFVKLGRLERVPELLDEMAKGGHLPDASAYNILIEAFAKEGRACEAMSVLRQMQSAGCVPTSATYSIVLDVYGQKGRYDDVRDLFLEMKVGNTAPDVETYNILLRTFGEGGYFREVVTLFRDMLDENVVPNMETYEVLLFACGKGGLYDDAKYAVMRMKSEGLVPSTRAYTGFVEACGLVAFYEEAFVAFNTMHEIESTPNIETYNSLIYGYGRGGLIKEAEAVVLRMNAAWMERDTHSFTGLVEAYCQGGKYDDAVKAYVEMQKSRCSPSERTLEAILRAYCMAELVDESREQFEEIRSARGAPSITAYCMMLSLYAKLDRWQDANEILEEMKENRTSSTHNIIACMINGEYDSGSNWQMVEYVFDKCGLGGCDYGLRFYNALLDALWWLNQRARAARVLTEARKRGLYPELFRQSKLVWSVDVHRMSIGAALTAVSAWLNDIHDRLKTEKHPPQLASVVVARGVMEESNATKVLSLPKAAYTYLKESISSSFEFPVWNKGRIVCQRSQLKKIRPAMLVADPESSSDKLSDATASTTDSLISLTDIPIPFSTHRKKIWTDDGSGDNPSIKKEAELLPS